MSRKSVGAHSLHWPAVCPTLTGPSVRGGFPSTGEGKSRVIVRSLETFRVAGRAGE